MTIDRNATTTALTAAALALALVYLVAGVAAMLGAPRVPYADQWLFYARLIEQPIGSYAYAAENGHREVLPKLVRWIELRHFDADQSLQIGLGLLFALATLSVLAWTAWRAEVPRAHRVAVMLVATIGIFWLGNERALAHSNDAIHAYLVTFFLCAGLILVARPCANESLRALLATLCALAATFSFGSGIAAFPAVLFVLAMRHAPARAWWPVATGFAVALLLYLSGDPAATTTTVRFDPLTQVALGLHWLASPLVYVFWPLLDADIAGRLPSGVVRETSVAIAAAWTSTFGDIRRSTVPQAIAGGLGVATFAGLAWQAWRARSATPAAVRIALGIAWFGLVVGAVIALTRAAYFEQHADQIQAPRYLVWSSLFWSGTAMALLLRVRTATRTLACALALAVLMLPSEVWMGRLAQSMRSAAEQAALGGVVGVLDRGESLGETRFEEMHETLPLLERDRVAMHAWPEASWLGRQLPAARWRPIEATNVAIEPIDNRFDGPGVRITANADDAAARLVVLDATGMAIGLLMRDPMRDREVWRGWARGTPDAASMRVVAGDD